MMKDMTTTATNDWAPQGDLVPTQDPRTVERIRDTYRHELRSFARHLFSDDGDSTAWLKRDHARIQSQSQSRTGAAFGVRATDGTLVDSTPVSVAKAEAVRRGADTARIGPVRALTVAGIRYTMVGDLADMGLMYGMPELQGTLITVSIAAWDRFNLRQTTTTDAYPWIPALLGDAWAALTYDSGTQSGHHAAGTAPALTTRYFRLHVSPTGEALPWPDGASMFER